MLRASGSKKSVNDSLFPEFDAQSFTAIGHRGYARLLRELRALQNRLYDCTKFDKLIRYRCANLFFLVLPDELFRDSEVPAGWGALVESDGSLILARKPVWHETTEANRIRLLHRIAVAGTRALNRKLHDPRVFLQPPKLARANCDRSSLLVAEARAEREG